MFLEISTICINIRRIPNKPKTVESVNLVNVKKTPVVVKGKQVNQVGVAAAAGGNAPITLQVDMINRNTALTPSVYNGDPGVSSDAKVNTSTVLSDEINAQLPPQ